MPERVLPNMKSELILFITVDFEHYKRCHHCRKPLTERSYFAVQSGGDF
jgi:hypothetical protein